MYIIKAFSYVVVTPQYTFEYRFGGILTYMRTVYVCTFIDVNKALLASTLGVAQLEYCLSVPDNLSP